MVFSRIGDSFGLSAHRPAGGDPQNDPVRSAGRLALLRSVFIQLGNHDLYPGFSAGCSVSGMGSYFDFAVGKTKKECPADVIVILSHRPQIFYNPAETFQGEIEANFRG